jgi:ATP synthase protein I
MTDELDAKLKSISEKIDKIQQHKKQNEVKPIHQHDSAKGYSVAMKIVGEFAGCIIVGVLIGIGFDTLFNTKPFLLLIFLILGFIAAFINLIRMGSKKNGGV